jgi:trimeric autotransporter adhesin
MLQQHSHAGLESHRHREAAVVRAQWTAAMAQDEDTRYRAGTPSTTAASGSLSRPMTGCSRPTTASATAGDRPKSSSAQGSRNSSSRGSSRRHKRASDSDANRVFDDSECATEAVPVENFFKRVPALQRRAAAHDSTIAACVCSSSNTVLDNTGCCAQCGLAASATAAATASATAVQSTAASALNQHTSISSSEATATPTVSTSGSTEASVSARVYTLVRIVAGRDWRVPGHELIVTDALTDLLTVAR